MKNRKENNSRNAGNKNTNENHLISFPQVSSWNPGLATALSLIVPGAGHMYAGSMNSGLKWFVSVLLGYAVFIFLGTVFHTLFVIPGIVLHTMSVVRAARTRYEIQDKNSR